jgi:hypothetical protein
MDNYRSKEKLTKIITEKPELLQNLNISPRKLFLFVEHLENNNVVVREKSEWKLNRNGSATCKKCRRTTKDAWDFDRWMNFCPSCGADMRGA